MSAAPEPRWVESHQQWILRIYKDRRIEKSFTSRDPSEQGKKDVIKHYHEWVAAGKRSASPNTVRYYWEQYLEAAARRNGEKSMANKRYIFTKYINGQIGTKRLSELEFDDIQAVIDRCAKIRVQSGPRKGKIGLSRKMLTSIKAEFSAFSKYCYRKGLIAPDGELLVITAQAEKAGKNFLEPDDVAALMSEEYDGYPSINYFRFLVSTGVRPGEAAGLKWSNIDGDVVTICRGLDQKGNVTHGKNPNARRSFAMIPPAVKAIEAQRALGIDSEWVFSYDGNPPKLKTLYSHWRGKDREHGRNRTPGLADHIGCPDTSLYSFRHSFITIATSSGMSLDDLRPMIGHSASMDTTGTYAHVTKKMRDYARDEAAKAFKKYLK